MVTLPGMILHDYFNNFELHEEEHENNNFATFNT